MNLIDELVETISDYGYEHSLEKWRAQADRLIIKQADPLLPASLRHILSIGIASGKANFICNGLWCTWGYILNLDEEVFEIYKGRQKYVHNLGRYFQFICPEPGHYPCALLTSIPLRRLTIFDPKTYIIGELISGGLDDFGQDIWFE